MAKSAISDKKTKYDSYYLCGTGGWAAGGNGRRVAGPEPQREATALGAVESAASEGASHHRGSFSDAADTRELTGAAAGAAERVH